MSCLSGSFFATPRNVPLTLRYDELVFELKPQRVAAMQETVPVKISVVSSDIVPELVGLPERSRPTLKIAPVVAPRAGKVLIVRFLVEAAQRNHDHVFKHFVCHSSDFSLVNGAQVIPLHKVLSNGYVLKEQYYQTDLNESNRRAPFTGELVFLVDSAVKTWDLHYGAMKVATFSTSSAP
jgi:hypothetical protein